MFSMAEKRSQQVINEANIMHKFMIISNPRTGSTYLETSLGQLSDVTCDYEMKFLYDPNIPGPYKDITSKNSILENLDEIGTGKITGSKLVFDTDYQIDKVKFDLLQANFNNDIKIIHLERNYYAIIKSWLIRGMVHKTNKEGFNIITNSVAMDSVWSDNIRKVQSLTYEQIFRVVFRMMVIDLAINSIKNNDYIRINYDDIEDRFKEIALFIGSGCGNVDAAIKDPFTEKLKMIDDKELKNYRVWKFICAYFDALKRKIYSKKLSFDYISRIKEDDISRVYLIGKKFY